MKPSIIVWALSATVNWGSVRVSLERHVFFCSAVFKLTNLLRAFAIGNVVFSEENAKNLAVNYKAY
jgi:hypothetical protein